MDKEHKVRYKHGHLEGTYIERRYLEHFAVIDNLKGPVEARQCAGI